MTVDADQQKQRPSDKVVMLGGTFDPIHNGHVVSALETGRILGAGRVYLLPCHIPPHGKTPSASAMHRLNMLKALSHVVPELIVDERELHRDRPSYTFDSVREVREEWGEAACLVWIIGWDSLQNLDTWHRWKEIFDYTNLAVVKRPGYFELNGPINNPILKEALAERWVDVGQLSASPRGKISLLETSEKDLSSSEIRRKIAAGESVEGDIPQPVWDYIRQNRLYGLQSYY